MSDPTTRISDAGIGETDEGREWLPREIVESPVRPRFRRLTPDERMRRREPRDPRPSEPPTSAIGSELARRIGEVENTVDRATVAIDRSNDLLRALFERRR
jgi:hypothetical protein